MIPSGVKSLIGQKFGLLRVKYYAGQDKNGKSLWCCLCECGTVLRVPGGKLIGTSAKPGHSQKSCGCNRADPEVRRVAREKVPAKKRRAIARKGAAASAGKHKICYSIDAHRAAELLGVSVERIEVLAQDGMVGSVWRRGALWVSSGDVADMVAVQQRNKRRCRVMDELMGLKDAS